MKISLIVMCLFAGNVPMSYAQESALTFKNESELGIVATSGNTQTQTISAKEAASVQTGLNLFKITGNFLKSSNFSIEQAYRWGLGVRYERELSPIISIYLGQNVESDKFQNILQRYNTDAGGKATLYTSNAFKWFSELGYRFTRNNFVASFRNDQFLRVYSEMERFFNKSVSAKWWFELLPNLSLWQAYRASSELSLSASLSEVFAVKSGYLFRYDNFPITGVTSKTDIMFTTALVARF
jgi:putative salt-induced outer membrane protein YdiY